MRRFKNILVTGGAGFIGANFIRYLFQKTDFRGRVVNLDKLTYAGNPLSLQDIAEQFPERYFLEPGDIGDYDRVIGLLQKYEIDAVAHFAAESHVDRSIHGPADFVKTNIQGTFVLLEAVRAQWAGREGVLFHHVSTDEVFGSLGSEGRFHETTPYDPRSPYSASKASSDHLVRAYHHTYGLPITVSNCSNNYGPFQFPEKLIPVMIQNLRAGEPLPVYGDGLNIRDWLYVEDHVEGIWTVMTRGSIGESYNIGGESERTNLQVIETLIGILSAETGQPEGTYRSLIRFVKDRPGHDRRYAIDCGKIKKELNWAPRQDFQGGMEKTVRWYMENNAWLESVKSGEYRRWMENHYAAKK